MAADTGMVGGPGGQIDQEEDVWVALCPELDVASQGETVEEAADMLDESVRLFLETCHEVGTLSEVLAESGVAVAVAAEADGAPPPVDVPMELVIGGWRQASQAVRPGESLRRLLSRLEKAAR